MIEKLKKLFTAEELLRGNFGIEREGLRVDRDGKLATTSHPQIFGEKICNPYITTDFSESQLEVITPTFNTAEGVYNFVNALYDIVALEIGDEYVWPQSMPAILPDDKNIPIAEYCECPQGVNARRYREKLMKKYGGKKQLISGIHYNFSFEEEFIERLYDSSNKSVSYKAFKDSIYLKVTRNYLRYRWLIINLLCVAPVAHESFDLESDLVVKNLSEDIVTIENSVSFRNGKYGYRNNHELYPSYNTVEEYVQSVNQYINDGVIDSHKELYSQIRLKAVDTKDFLDSLVTDGIKYLEYRTIDINPFEKGGIALVDLKFLQLFNLFLLLEDENNYGLWQQEALVNQDRVAEAGISKITLLKDGVEVSKASWALEIIDKIEKINNNLKLGYEEIIKVIRDRILDVKNTYVYRLNELVAEKGFVQGHLELAKIYKELAYNHRYKLSGYEDLELSTQILMKESIKRGIKVEVMDRHENFIKLKKCDKEEYIMQATKTSKDNYVTVLIMENKVMTKKVLESGGIRVPKGDEYNSIEEAYGRGRKFENKAIVIKPKSTNFGLGISIFPEGANFDDMKKAFEIAFSHDKTVLIEEFIKGKEFRFLVIDDKVEGILHRVPANVIGDGLKTITELVEIKNQDPLRGRGYVTPLEKIKLDENAKLFLKQRGLDFNHIPKKDEIVYLRENSNISTGGDSIDFTDIISDKFKAIAVEATKAVGARICGVDMMLEDYSDENTAYAIIELNFNPAIHIHSYPYKGTERKIAEKVLKVLGLVKKEA